MTQNEQQLLAQVAALVEQEHQLREQLAEPADPNRGNQQAALWQLEEELDQCWDLLRQRRALQAVQQDPSLAQVRPAEQVENYLPRPDQDR